MLKRTQTIAIILAVCTGLTGCISAKSFVDPSKPKLSYDDLVRRDPPLKLVLSVEFQRDGEPFAKADSTLRDNAERVLRGTGVITPVNDGGVGTVKVVVNNLGEKGAAVKGFGTGLTFGLVGSTVMDAYELSMTVKVADKTVTRSAVKHALYTAIGNASLPSSVEAVPPNVAFGRVVEQMLLQALRDMQQAGELNFARASVPPAVPKASAWDMTAWLALSGPQD